MELFHCRLSSGNLTHPSGGCLHQYTHKLKIIVDNCRGSHYFSVFGPAAEQHESLCANEGWGVGITETPGENKQGFGHAGCHGMTARNPSPPELMVGCAWARSKVKPSRCWSNRRHLFNHVLAVCASPMLFSFLLFKSTFCCC